MTDTQAGCQCGCNLVTDISNATEACGCGCACCSEAPKSAAEEVAELHALRDRIDQRLAELDAS